MLLNVSTDDRVDAAATDAIVAAEPDSAVVYDGTVCLNASRNAGVPKVSVRAIPRTFQNQFCLTLISSEMYLHLRQMYRPSNVGRFH